MLTRRTAIRAVGALVIGTSGCFATSDSDSTQSRTRSSTATATSHRQSATPPDTTASPTDTTPTPAPATLDDFSFSAEVIEQFTEGHTARCRLAIENTCDYSLSVKYRLGPRNAHYEVDHASSDAKLVMPPADLVPAALTDPDTGDNIAVTPQRTDGCWRLNADLLLTRDVLVYSIESGADHQETFEVYAHRENEGCLPPGTYRYTRTRPMQTFVGDRPQVVGAGVPVTFDVALSISEGNELRIKSVDARIEEDA